MNGPKGTRGVVVGYDGSDFAMRALDWAMDEAESRGQPLTVCHAWQWPYGDAGEEARDSLRHAAEHVVWHGAECARACMAGPEVNTDLYEGSAAERLVELSAGAELLVVGSRGLGGLVGAPAGSVGSVGRSVAAAAHCPVIVVRGVGALPRRARPGPIAAGVDGDGDLDLVLGFACREAAMRHVPLMAVHAWSHHPVFAGAVGAVDPVAVREAAEERVARALAPWRTRYPDLVIEISAAEGPARQELLEAAVDATLLVVGAPESRFGSMTIFMLDHAPCPVAIVRTQEVGHEHAYH